MAGKFNQSEYMKEYRKSNKDKILESKKSWAKRNPEKAKKYNQDHRKKYPWLVVLWSARSRCNNKNEEKYHRYGGRGIECLITKEEIKELWFRDKADSLKKPTIDRINNDGHYEYSNCRFIESGENSRCRAESYRKKEKIADTYNIIIAEKDKEIKILKEKLAHTRLDEKKVRDIIVNTQEGAYTKAAKAICLQQDELTKDG